MTKSLVQLSKVRAARHAVLAACVLALPSCSRDARAIKACEAALLPTLKAPASYSRVSDMVGPPQGGRQTVIITYDAVNSFNAPLRDTFVCTFNPTSGGAASADKSQDEVADDLSIPNDADVSRTPEPLPPGKPSSSQGQSRKLAVTDVDSGDEVPVCDRPDSAAKSALMNEIGTDCLGE